MRGPWVRDRASQKPVERLVDRILVAKAHDSEADVSELEREMDGLIFDLYDLTELERAIIEKTE